MAKTLKSLFWESILAADKSFRPHANPHPITLNTASGHTQAAGGGIGATIRSEADSDFVNNIFEGDSRSREMYMFLNCCCGMPQVYGKAPSQQCPLNS